MIASSSATAEDILKVETQQLALENRQPTPPGSLLPVVVSVSYGPNVRHGIASFLRCYLPDTSLVAIVM